MIQASVFLSSFTVVSLLIKEMDSFCLLVHSFCFVQHTRKKNREKEKTRRLIILSLLVVVVVKWIGSIRKNREKNRLLGNRNVSFVYLLNTNQSCSHRCEYCFFSFLDTLLCRPSMDYM